MKRVSAWALLFALGASTATSEDTGAIERPAAVVMSYQPAVDGVRTYFFSQEMFNRLGGHEGGMTVAGKIAHEIRASEADGLIHEIEITRLSAQYVDHDGGDHRYDRPVEALLGRSLLLHTDSAGRVRRLPQADRLPSIPGIAISTLLELRDLVPPLPSGPVRPGDRWRGDEKITFERQDGGVSNLEMEWQLEFAGMEEREGRSVMKIVGTSVLKNDSAAGPEQRFSSTERRLITGYFAPEEGLFVALEIDAGESPMRLEGKSDGSVKEGVQRYRYLFRRENP